MLSGSPPRCRASAAGSGASAAFWPWPAAHYAGPVARPAGTGRWLQAGDAAVQADVVGRAAAGAVAAARAVPVAGVGPEPRLGQQLFERLTQAVGEGRRKPQARLALA